MPTAVRQADTRSSPGATRQRKQMLGLEAAAADLLHERASPGGQICSSGDSGSLGG